MKKCEGLRKTEEILGNFLGKFYFMILLQITVCYAPVNKPNPLSNQHTYPCHHVSYLVARLMHSPYPMTSKVHQVFVVLATPSLRNIDNICTRIT